MDKISVIVPADNAETTLRTAVESILSQQVPAFFWVMTWMQGYSLPSA